MRIIDFHTHVYPERIARKATLSVCDFYDLESDNIGSPEELLTLGAKAGIRTFVILPVAVRPDLAEGVNNFIRAECDRHSEFVGFGTVHAEMDDIVSEVEHIRALGLRGIKMHPDTQRFNIDDERLYPMYEEVEGKMPVYLHTGDPRYDFSHPRRLRRVLEDFPKLQVIAAHLGGWSVFEEAQEYLRDKDCFVDISSSMMFLTPEKTVNYIRGFGAERVLFGSDYPLWDPAKEAEEFLVLPLTAAEKELIAHANAERLLGI